MLDQILGVLIVGACVVAGLTAYALLVLPAACAICRRLRRNQPTEAGK